MTLKAAIFIYIRAHAFEERAGNNNMYCDLIIIPGALFESVGSN